MFVPHVTCMMKLLSVLGGGSVVVPSLFVITSIVLVGFMFVPHVVINLLSVLGRGFCCCKPIVCY